MKKFIMLITIAICISYTASAYNIDALKQADIVIGDEGGLRENDNVTRAEYVKMINRLFGLELNNKENTFKDVPKYKWYYNDINTALNYGYIKGDENEYINPENNITRQEAYALTARLTGYKNILKTPFSNDGHIDEWAKGCMTSLYEMGYLDGSVISLDPKGYITRKECFEIFDKILSDRFASGKGNEDNPYIISYPHQLSNIKFYPNSYFKIANELDFNLYNLSFYPIKEFNGVLDGGKNKIVITKKTDSFNGALFEKIGKTAKFIDVNILCVDYKVKDTVKSIKGISYLKEENFNEFSGGLGTKENPFRISKEADFKNINLYKNAHFIQTNNIVFSTPVVIDTFSGSYNGNGYSLSNLQFMETDKNSALFVENKGVLSDIKLTDSLFFSLEEASSLCINNFGSIINCSSSATVKGKNASGLVLENNGEIKSSYFYGVVYGGKTSAIAFYNNKKIINSIENCSFKSSNVGCIAFSNYGDITNCLYTSDFKGQVENKGFSNAQRAYSLSISLLNEKGIENKPYISEKYTPALKENTTDFAGGTGSKSNPYVITSPIHLNNIRYYPFSSFILANNIDMSYMTSKDNLYWNNSNGFTPLKNFYGTFDGNSFTIRGLYSTKPFITNNYGTITNLTVKAFKIVSDNSSSLCLNNYGNIAFCKNNSEISSTQGAGFAIYNYGKISMCVNNALISANKAASIALYNVGFISDCINVAEIMGVGENSLVYGIASGGNITGGYNIGDMYFSSSEGTIYPVSDEKYQNTYFLNRYNSSQKGGLVYEDFSAYMFDNKTIYSSYTINYPTLNYIDFTDVKFPTGYESGNGKADDPFIISSEKDLYNIRMYPDAHFKLSRNIILDNCYNDINIYNNMGLGFSPIEKFSGVLDGNKFSIYSLNMSRSDYGSGALIENLTGKISDLTIAESQIEGKGSTSAFCINNNGTISNCILRDSRIGSLDGIATGFACINKDKGIIENCLNYADIFSKNVASGIAGHNNGKIIDCINYGGIVSSSDETATSGGISGINKATISQCVNSGKIFAYSDMSTAIAGGIAGTDYIGISDSFNIGDIVSKSIDKTYTGGIVGYCSDSSISRCYSIGYVLATSKNAYSGSLAGGGVSGKISSGYYDQTLTSPAGQNCIRLNSALPLSLEQFTDISNLNGFSEKVWFVNPYSAYPFPQLKANPYIPVSLSENVRDFAGGNGSLENPYKIITTEHLANVSKYLGASFTLLADIDLTDTEFSQIGNHTFSFFGSFMGNGHVIKGLDANTGLFRINHGDIYSLKLENVSTNALTSGGICSINTGLIYGCGATLNINTAIDNSLTTGGLAGINKHSGMIVSSFADGVLTQNSKTSVAGGICGYNYGLVAGCFNNSNVSVTVSNTAMLGGICGYNYGTISDSINYATVICNPYPTATSYCGGLTSGNSGTILNCISTAEKVTGTQTGALFATNNNSNTNNCYYLDTVKQPFELENVFRGNYTQMSTPTFFKGFDTETMWYFEDGMYPILLETTFLHIDKL